MKVESEAAKRMAAAVLEVELLQAGVVELLQAGVVDRKFEKGSHPRRWKQRSDLKVELLGGYMQIKGPKKSKSKGKLPNGWTHRQH